MPCTPRMCVGVDLCSVASDLALVRPPTAQRLPCKHPLQIFVEQTGYALRTLLVDLDWKVSSLKEKLTLDPTKDYILRTRGKKELLDHFPLRLYQLQDESTLELLVAASLPGGAKVRTLLLPAQKCVDVYSSFRIFPRKSVEMFIVYFAFFRAKMWRCL